jgi:AraC family transcriptional regulator
MLPERLGVRLAVDPAGILDTPARPHPYLVIHVGTPVEIACERGGRNHRGLAVHGDIDIVPAGTAARWILRKQDSALVIRVSQDLLSEAANELGLTPGELAIANRFQTRDAKIEHLGWALKAEMEHGFAGGRLYMDSIGLALASQLLQAHSDTVPHLPRAGTSTLPPVRMRKVLGYIEEHLTDDLSLGAIAGVSGLSVSQCQRVFRVAFGCPIHHYVVQRRIERAKLLLRNRELPISEVALAVGFSHQSHLSYHMRRLEGASPLAFRKNAG